MSDDRCFKERAPDASPPLFQHGTLTFQAHWVGWVVSAFFTLVAIVASFWLINKHLQWYTNKREQRYIVRLLFMVPIYATISLASFIFWNHATPLLLIRDCYESTVLTAFFYLLLVYISPDAQQQKAVFLKRGLSRQYDQGRKWMFPLGFVKAKPEDGLYFLQLMKWGVLQYCVVRPTTTLVAVILDYIGLYCETSWSPRWGYVYITAVVSISVTVAMYCLLQLYVTVSQELAPKKPLLKLFAVKAVVFLTFWQATGVGLLGTFGFIKDTKYMTAGDIETGLSALLETFEMAVFAFVHFRAFTYRVYKPFTLPSDPPPPRTPRLASLGHAMDFRETLGEIGRAVGWAWKRWRGRETDVKARRGAVFEEAFGRSRTGGAGARGEGKEEEEGPRGRDTEFEGYVRGGKRSWWMGVYDRVSQSGADEGGGGVFLSSPPLMTYDDPPPLSGIRNYRRRKNDREMERREGGGASPEPHDGQLAFGRDDVRELEMPVPPAFKGDDGNLLSPPRMSRSDSVLGRLFPPGVATTSNDSGSSVFGKEATPGARRSAAVQESPPRRTSTGFPPVRPPTVHENAGRERPDRHGLPRLIVPSPGLHTSSSRARDHHHPPPSRRPTRDEIVLPAPLAAQADPVPSPPPPSMHVRAQYPDGARRDRSRTVSQFNPYSRYPLTTRMPSGSAVVHDSDQVVGGGFSTSSAQVSSTAYARS